MLLSNLVKKDILIAKNNLLLILLVIGAIPLFVQFVAPSVPGFASLTYMVVLGEVMIMQAIAQEETKQPKTMALLCAAPYPRKTVVYAKYVLFFLIFAYCIAVHTVTMLFVNMANIVDLTSILTVMLLGAVLFGIYVPTEFRYGVVKAQVIFTIVILSLSLGPSILVRLFADTEFDFSFLEFLKSISPIGKNLMLAVGTALIITVSMLISKDIFLNKEL